MISCYYRGLFITIFHILNMAAVTWLHPARRPQLARVRDSHGSSRPQAAHRLSDKSCVMMESDRHTRTWIWLFMTSFNFWRINCPFCASPRKLFSDKVTQINSSRFKGFFKLFYWAALR